MLYLSISTAPSSPLSRHNTLTKDVACLNEVHFIISYEVSAQDSYLHMADLVGIEPTTY